MTRRFSAAVERRPASVAPGRTGRPAVPSRPAPSGPAGLLPGFLPGFLAVARSRNRDSRTEASSGAPITGVLPEIEGGRATLFLEIGSGRGRTHRRSPRPTRRPSAAVRRAAASAAVAEDHRPPGCPALLAGMAPPAPPVHPGVARRREGRFRGKPPAISPFAGDFPGAAGRRIERERSALHLEGAAE